jgi:hypothetical protein
LKKGLRREATKFLATLLATAVKGTEPTTKKLDAAVQCGKRRGPVVGMEEVGTTTNDTTEKEIEEV